MLERILAAPSALVALEECDSAMLIRQFATLSRQSGQSIYLWQPDAGLASLREAHVRMPGLQQLGGALRYMLQSNHFGIYLLSGLTMPIAAANLLLLRQLARESTAHVRRVVLVDAGLALLGELGEAVVRLRAEAKPPQRPRLRDGRWVF